MTLGINQFGLKLHTGVFIYFADSEDFMIVTELAPLGDLPKYLKAKKVKRYLPFIILVYVFKMLWSLLWGWLAQSPISGVLGKNWS